MPIGEIDNFSIEVNDIITPIKVLVIEATQYQALVGNDWLSKNNVVLNWTIQELQLSQNGQHMQVLTMCGHFKSNNVTTLALLIDLKKEKLKLTWEVYQVSWTDIDHNKLPPIFIWDDDNNRKKEQEKEPTCGTTIDAWTDDKDHHKLPPIRLWDDNSKGKQRKELTWETYDLIWTNNDEREPTLSWKWKESNKGKKKAKEEEPLPTNPYTSY
ncbi:hypothetical protein G9A89_016785 [Geosiphon pyriformis]|nr:hypothetical protein G9A89_016785 [Geosiphon pyriformis]